MEGKLTSREFKYHVKFRTDDRREYIFSLAEGMKAWKLGERGWEEIKIVRRTKKLLYLLLNGYHIDYTEIKIQSNVTPCHPKAKIQEYCKRLNLKRIENIYGHFSLLRKFLEIPTGHPLIGSDDVSQWHWTFDPTYHDIEYENEKAEEWRKYELGKLEGATDLVKPSIFPTVKKGDSPVDGSVVLPEVERQTLHIEEPEDMRSDNLPQKSPIDSKETQTDTSHTTQPGTQTIIEGIKPDESPITPKEKWSSRALTKGFLAFLAIASLVMIVTLGFKQEKGNSLESSNPSFLPSTDKAIQDNNTTYYLSSNTQEEGSDSNAVLDIKVTNESNSVVVITKARLRVKSFVPDPRPILKVIPLHRRLGIENIGDGEVLGGKISFRIDTPDNPPSQPFSCDFGAFGKKTDTPLLDDTLRTWGIDVDAANPFRIEKDQKFSLKFYIGSVEVSNGEFEKYSKWHKGYIQDGFIAVTGTIEYSSTDLQSNNPKHFQTAFRSHIGLIRMPKEILEMKSNESYFPSSYTYTAKLVPNRKDYDVDIPLSQAVKPGEIDRFSVLVYSERSAIVTYDLTLFIGKGKIPFDNMKIEVEKNTD